MRTGTQGGIEMKAFPFKSNLLVLTLTLLFVLGPGSGKAQGDVKIRGEKLPSDVLHVVDMQFQDPNNEGVQQIQFRDLSYSHDEAKELFLSTDPDENLLRLIGETLSNENQVKFRGTVEGTKFEARVERHDDGTLHARIKGLDIGSLAPEQLGEFLSNGFDRLRIRGTDGERFEIRRQEDGTLRANIKGMNLSGITAEQLTSLAVENGFERLRIRGSDGERFELVQRGDGNLRAKVKGLVLSGDTAEQLTGLAVEKGFNGLRMRGSNGQRFEIKRLDNGSLRAKIYGVDVSGQNLEQITNIVVDNGLNRLRIRGLDGERLEFERQDNGSLRAELERMDLSNSDPKEILASLRAKGLDRVRIEGVGIDGNEIRIEFRQDKGIVKIEGIGGGLTQFSRDLNTEQARDRGRDWEKKIRNRIEREKHERFGHGDNRGRGSDRIGAWRERVETHVRERIERHGGRGRH